MIELYNKNNILNIKNSDNKIISVDTENKKINIDDFNLDFPGEYEKSWILIEVKEYGQKLFYDLLIEWETLVVIFDENFDMQEEIMSFFWDVDILIIIWNKNSTKIVENIEARVVVPFWEGKDLFLHTLWQNKEEIETFKLKVDMWIENTEFVNLK